MSRLNSTAGSAAGDRRGKVRAATRPRIAVVGRRVRRAVKVIAGGPSGRRVGGSGGSGGVSPLSDSSRIGRRCQGPSPGVRGGLGVTTRISGKNDCREGAG